MLRLGVTIGPTDTSRPRHVYLCCGYPTIHRESEDAMPIQNTSSAVSRGRTGMGRYDGRNAYRDDGGFTEFAKLTNLMSFANPG
jgi:hypothetical protein